MSYFRMDTIDMSDVPGILLDTFARRALETFRFSMSTWESGKGAKVPGIARGSMKETMRNYELESS